MYTALKVKINKNTVKAIQKRIDIYNSDNTFKEFSIGKWFYVISDINPEVLPYVKRYRTENLYSFDCAIGNIINGIFVPDYMFIKRS